MLEANIVISSILSCLLPTLPVLIHSSMLVLPGSTTVAPPTLNRFGLIDIFFRFKLVHNASSVSVEFNSSICLLFFNFPLLLFSKVICLASYITSAKNLSAARDTNFEIRVSTTCAPLFDK